MTVDVWNSHMLKSWQEKKIMSWGQGMRKKLKYSMYTKDCPWWVTNSTGEKRKEVNSALTLILKQRD